MANSATSLIPFIESSNVPVRMKPRVVKWLDKAMSEGAHVGVVDALVQGGAAMATGASLGAASAVLKDGLDFGKKVPLDLATGALATLGAVVVNSHASLAVANACDAVYGFRKGSQFFGKMRTRISGEADEEHGAGVNVGDDPVLAAAREMEL